MALRHRVLGLVHDGLRRARLDVPPVVGREIAAQMVRENLAMAAEALRLQRLFDEADLLVLSIKCPSLAVLAFGTSSCAATRILICWFRARPSWQHRLTAHFSILT